MPASNLNVVILTGNLTKDPELKETGSGTSVCELRLASNSSVKKNETWESKPNFFQVNVWGGLAENCAKFLSKGSKIGIKGRLEWQRWETKEGETNSRVVVVAESVEFLSPKSESSTSTQDDDIPFE